MSSYIEQEHIGRVISNLPTEVFQTENRIELVLSATEAIDAIKVAPTIDIVFCRECKYWIGHLADDDSFDGEDECRWRDSESPNADDFCSYGSRSEKPNNSKERSSE